MFHFFKKILQKRKIHKQIREMNARLSILDDMAQNKVQIRSEWMSLGFINDERMNLTLNLKILNQQLERLDT